MFCRFLSNTYHFTYDNVKPCCWIKHTPETQINILDPDIKGKMEKIRQTEDWIPECSYCYNLEAAGTSSPRITKDVDLVYTEDDKIGDPVKVELQLDDDCNAACLICGTWNSTTWQEYEVKTLKTTEISYRWLTTVDQRVEAVKNTIDFDKTKQVHFFGGEPFNSNTQLKMLQLMNRPENINLVYTTNGSVFPCDETLELWKKFKSVHIGISLDGVGEQFNYLRWPLQWHQVENNLKKYTTLGDNITLNTSFTATPFNIFYIDKYTEWAIEFAKNNDTPKTKKFHGWFLNPHPVVGLNITMSSSPPALKEVIKQKYGMHSRIFKLIQEFDLEKCKHMIEYVQFHDAKRKLNWRETFPDIVQYFDEVL